jgi:hypothetical protein
MSPFEKCSSSSGLIGARHAGGRVTNRHGGYAHTKGREVYGDCIPYSPIVRSDPDRLCVTLPRRPHHVSAPTARAVASPPTGSSVASPTQRHEPRTVPDADGSQYDCDFYRNMLNEV